jgi:5-hydroxyisourate hydrolase-like protein (transthyretin family)
MQRTLLRVWVLLAVLVTPILASCDSGGSSAEEPMDTEVNVMGTVTSDSGDPISGASVEVDIPNDGTSLASTSTDSSGTYETTFTVFEENAPNQLRLTFAAGGFMDKQVTVAFDPEVELDVTLEEITPESLSSEAGTP